MRCWVKNVRSFRRRPGRRAMPSTAFLRGTIVTTESWIRRDSSNARRLAGIALEERKGLIIVGNKWDLVREQTDEFTQSDLAQAVREAIPFAAFAPITFLSAKTHRRLGGLMPIAARVAENLDKRVATPELNTALRKAMLAHPPTATEGRLFRIYYVSQPATHPPVFVFHCNDPDLVQTHYKRFLENTIRQHFDFEGVPLTLEFRARRERDRLP